MKLKLFFFLLFIALMGCNMQPQKSKTSKQYSKVQQKPSLDSFFEKMVDVSGEEEFGMQSKKTINIAIILPITGIYSRIGSEGLDAIVLAQKHLGNRVKVKVFDSAGLKSNIGNIHSQIEEGGFDVIIGPLFNFETKELADMEKNLPIISLSNDTSIKQSNILMFGLNANDNIQDSVSFFTSIEKGNIMAMFPNSANGAKQYRVFKTSVEKNNGSIMRVEFYDDTGVSDVSRYTSKITNGLIQRQYFSRQDGNQVTEKTIRDQEKYNPNFNIDDFYETKENKADVLFVYGSNNKMLEITSILNRPSNKEKLKDVSVVLLDFDFYNANLSVYNKMFFYANSYAKFKRFSDDIKDANGYAPTKLSAVLFDAIFYAVHVNNQSFGGINKNKIHTEYDGFNGVMGSFTIQSGYVKRAGKMMFVKDGYVKELIPLFSNEEGTSKNLLDKNIDTDINYLNEDLD